MFTNLLLVFLSFTITPTDSVKDTIHHFNQLAEQYSETLTDFSFYYANQAYQLAKTIQYEKGLAEAAYQIGRYYYKQKQYEEALSRYQEAQTIAVQQKDTLLLANVFDKIAAVLRRKGNTQQALFLQKTALQYAYSINKPKLLISLLKNLGSTCWVLKKYDSALYFYQQRIPLCASQGNTQDLIEANTDIANLLYILRKFEDAIPYYEEAITLSKKVKDIKSIATISVYLANAYVSINANQKAYYTLLNSLSVLQHIPNQRELAVAYTTLGRLSMQLAAGNEAIDFFEKSLIAFQHLKDEEGIAISLINLGMAYYYLKDYANAKKQFLKSKKISNAHDFTETLAYTYDNLGRVYLAIGQSDSALYFYQLSLQIRDEISQPPHPNLADVHTELAKTYLTLGQYEQVAHHIRESVGALGLENDPDTTSIFTLPLGSHPVSSEEYLDLMRLKGDYLSTAFTDAGAWEAGLQHYETCIQFLLRSYIYAQDMDQSKLAWLTTYRPVFESAIAVAYRLFKATHKLAFLERAFALTEQSKALLLRQSLLESYAQVSGNLPDSIVIAEQALKQKIAQKETELLKATMEEDSTKAWQLRGDLSTLQYQYAQWVEHVEVTYPDYFKLKYDIHTVTMQEIQQQLSPHSLMVNYFLGEKYLYSFGISKDTLLCQQVVLPADWNNRFQTYYQSLTDYNYLISNKDEVKQTIAREGYFFYQTLLAPLLENAGEDLKKLIVIPDEALHLLPFSVLLTQQPETTNYSAFPYLLKKLPVQYAASSSLYFQPLLAKNENIPYAFGGFSADYGITDRLDSVTYNRLPKAQQLAKEAAETMDGAVWENTTKAIFLEEAPLCRVIHFGGHAIAGNANLSDNRLVFQSDPGNDRYLYLPEIYNLNLHATKLVVLSACNTGTGAIKTGEGVISVARAFQHAGSQNLLMALNVISDEQTRRLLGGFYENLSKGNTIDASLQQAKLRYLEEHKGDELLSHPLYWASLITFGRHEEETSLKKIPVFALIGGLCVLISCLLFWFYTKKIRVKKQYY